MTEPDENNEEVDAMIGEAPVEDGGAEPSEEDGGTVIRDTDIVFDCPHCGHNLAIDYRGAGLQIECVNCGESVLVPIPDGMKIDDLDIEPGEILKQLFAARRNLQKAEVQIEAYQIELNGLTLQRNALQALMESSAIRLEEFKELIRNEAKLRDKALSLITRMSDDISASVGDAAYGDDQYGEGEVVAGT